MRYHAIKRNWGDYNKNLVKRGEILIDPEIPDKQSQNNHTPQTTSGIKLTNKEERLNKKHIKRERKGWIRVPVAFDLGSNRVSEMKVTDNKTHDSERSVGLIETAGRKAEAVVCRVKEVVADTGYNSHEIFRYLGEDRIKLVIKVRRGAVITGNRARDEVVREIRAGAGGRRETAMVGVGM